ncbi:unnamed protein product [Orchesella dallaii]|uniref:Uncharacterized protein n=1 Tax=Orchesella dallaii TaxID=48710 RepID=A0ABP1PRS3_9HEXA
MESDYDDILGSCRREAFIIGILDMILAFCLIVTNGLISWFYNYAPSIALWIALYVLHTCQFATALCLVSAATSMDKDDLNCVSRTIQKCKAWRYFSRFLLDWLFPMECFFLVMQIGGNGSQYLWICCGLVNALFRFVAEKSILQYMITLQRHFIIPSEVSQTELNTFSIQTCSNEPSQRPIDNGRNHVKYVQHSNELNEP